MTSKKENDVARDARSVSSPEAAGRFNLGDVALVTNYLQAVDNGGRDVGSLARDAITRLQSAVKAARSESEDTQPKATPTQDDVDALVERRGHE